MMKFTELRLVPTLMIIAVLLALAQQGCEENVAPVTDFANEPVNRAATELKKKCIEVLRQGLRSPDWDRRVKTALALSAMRDPAGLDDARAIMAGHRSDAALRVAYYFVRSGLAPTEPALIEADAMLRKGRASLKYLAITVLGPSSPGQEVPDPIKNVWKDTGHSDFQVCAASALARKGHRDAIKWLRANVESWLRFQGFDPFLFARLANEESQVVLMEALRTGADYNIRNAILAAETTKDDRALSTLSILLARKHGVRKTMAAAVLAELGGREGDTVLKQVVGQQMPAFPEAAWAAMGLGSLGDPSGMWALVKFIEREGASRRGTEAASLIIASLCSPGNAVSASFQLWIAEHI
ncbi:MAG TPA: hypothetical protein VM163_08475 [bacterium]|nr:hypothetical protein [bacterium]